MCLRLCDLYDADAAGRDPDVQRLRATLRASLPAPEPTAGQMALTELRVALQPERGAS